jgi:hypothetical protein
MTNRKMLAMFDGEFRLSPGNHASIEDGMCAMELVAFLDGAPHTDRPRCTSEAIADFVRHINDHMPDDIRQRLLPYLPRLIGTASAEFEQERIEYFAWQTIRVFAPAALRAQGYRGFATRLERAEHFYQAMRVSRAIRERISKKRAMTPVDLAVHRAFRAAGSAASSKNSHEDLFCYFDRYCACGYLAASAAFQAYQAGCTNIWDRVFETLEGVLEIGPRMQPGTEPGERIEAVSCERDFSVCVC